MRPLAGLVIAYLAGSIPFAYLAGKLFKGIDLREHGSGNLGATNVFRVMGWKIASLVMLLDMAKGALPVLLLPARFAPTNAELWAIAFGVAAIAGHVSSRDRHEHVLAAVLVTIGIIVATVVDDGKIHPAITSVGA